MTHPASVSRLPGECVLVEEDFTINYTAAGRCLYKPYLGVAYRDKGHTQIMVLRNQVFTRHRPYGLSFLARAISKCVNGISESSSAY